MNGGRCRRPPVPSPRRARPPYHREHPRALHPTSRRPRRCKPLVTGAAAAEPNRSVTFHLQPRSLGFCDWTQRRAC
uniref:Uncharacterized protein n=1 Tax=Cricetulus griseus TaxID=10029 RepID=A0A8C2LVK1_CRIGR